jgi:hypothetical protein
MHSLNRKHLLKCVGKVDKYHAKLLQFKINVTFKWRLLGVLKFSLLQVVVSSISFKCHEDVLLFAFAFFIMYLWLRFYKNANILINMLKIYCNIVIVFNWICAFYGIFLLLLFFAAFNRYIVTKITTINNKIPLFANIAYWYYLRWLWLQLI